MSENQSIQSVKDNLEHAFLRIAQHPADQILLNKHPKLQLELLAQGLIQNTFTATELKRVREYNEQDLLVNKLESNLALLSLDHPESINVKEVFDWTKPYDKKTITDNKDRLEALVFDGSKDLKTITEYNSKLPKEQEGIYYKNTVELISNLKIGFSIAKSQVIKIEQLAQTKGIRVSSTLIPILQGLKQGSPISKVQLEIIKNLLIN